MVDQARAALAAGDTDGFRLLLHPYLHWTEGRVRLHGRLQVLAHLAGRTELDPPDSVELRDGQIYRWLAGLPPGDRTL